MSICDASEEVEYGTLCAIQPSRLDSNARDRFSETGPADRNLGFGYHVVGFPIEGTTINGVYIHFTGSMEGPIIKTTKNTPLAFCSMKPCKPDTSSSKLPITIAMRSTAPKNALEIPVSIIAQVIRAMRKSPGKIKAVWSTYPKLMP